jgi:type VI secretion system protein ImpG
MKRLRTYYERELASLYGFSREYAEQFPAQAERLGIAAGGDGDPHIERFIQATALSNARTAQLIDDNDAKVTEALLNVNYPHYLQPFPSCAIVRIDPDNGAAATTIARGAMLSCVAPGQPPCRFRTVFDVALTGVALLRAFFSPLIDAPAGAARTAGESAAFSFEIACAPGGPGLAEARTLRLFIDAEQSLSSSVRDMLFMRARSAYLEAPGVAGWIGLEDVPILPVGFAADEALIPFGASSHVAYRLLTEFFAFPDKFNFVDIDLAALARRLPAGCRRATLHLGLDLDPSRAAADAAMAQRLAGLSAQQFVAGCTPVVNLFRRAACPIELDHTAPDYALMPDAGAGHGIDIHSVDRVRVVGEARGGQAVTEFRPYYSLRHGEAGGKDSRYYLLRHDVQRGRAEPGHHVRIALVDLDLDPLAVLDASVSVELTCTNGDLPSRLRYGAAGSELHLEQVAGGFPLQLLRRPTPQRRFALDAHWRLISHLSLNHGSLVQDGVGGLKEMLTLYDLAQSPVSRKQIAGIAGLTQHPARAWLRDDGHASLVHGIELRLTLDEDAFAGAGLHLFVQVLDHFLGLYVHLNSFIQLTVLSQASGKELYRCQPRSGARNLV